MSAFLSRWGQAHGEKEAKCMRTNVRRMDTSTRKTATTGHKQQRAQPHRTYTAWADNVSTIACITMNATPTTMVFQVLFLDSAFLRWCVMHGKTQSIPLGLMKHVWKRSQKQISIFAPCLSSFSSAYHDERGVCRGPCVWTAKQKRINIWQCSMRCFIHVWQVSI